jgi:hypothetical protein
LRIYCEFLKRFAAVPLAFGFARTA